MRQFFFSRAEMIARGWSVNGLAAAVHAGDLIRPRIGHYCFPDTPLELVRAVRVGGSATATTAARVTGLWTPPDDTLRVAVPRNTPRLRDPDDATKPLTDGAAVHLHWLPTAPTARTPTGSVSIDVLLAHAFAVLRPELWLAMVDSALFQRQLRTHQLAALAATLPARAGGVLALADARSESGLETIVRYLLQLHGLRVEIQVLIRGVGRVDLLVERRLIIETDGRATHAESFEADRVRDVAAAGLHYRTMRLTYRQVMFDWPATEAAILAALA